MSDVTKWLSSKMMVDLFQKLGQDPRWQFSHEVDPTKENQKILWSPSSTESHLVLSENTLNNKEMFLSIFLE